MGRKERENEKKVITNKVGFDTFLDLRRYIIYNYCKQKILTIDHQII